MTDGMDGMERRGEGGREGRRDEERERGREGERERGRQGGREAGREGRRDEHPVAHRPFVAQNGESVHRRQEVKAVVGARCRSSAAQAFMMHPCKHEHGVQI